MSAVCRETSTLALMPLLDCVVDSISVKEIFQRVTDAWSLKFVRQREN